MNIRPATEQDLLGVSGWFLTELEVKNWGGPLISFPLDLEQLKIDIEWDIVDSYALVNNGELIGFAQASNKFGCRHLGKIAIAPIMRGRKIGYKFMSALLDIARKRDKNFSLFVYDHNSPAKKLYERIGFEVRAYPEERDVVEGCSFMIKKAAR